MELVIPSLEVALPMNSTNWNRNAEQEGKPENWTTEL